MAEIVGTGYHDTLSGTSGNDVIYGDGVNGDLTHTVSASYGGRSGAITANGSDMIGVSGYGIGQNCGQDLMVAPPQAADLGALGGHGKGIGVQGAQASRPSIKQETGYDPIAQESEGIVFDVGGDAITASFDLSYFFSADSGADRYHNEVGRWVVYDGDEIVASGEFVANSKSGNFTLDIPQIDNGNTTFNKVVLEGLPYQAPEVGSKAWNKTGNFGTSDDSSDFLIKSASFELVSHDSLEGGDGNDELHGGLGNDTLDGGADQDKLFGDKGHDRLIAHGDGDTLDGGEGYDTVDYRGFVNESEDGARLEINLQDQLSRYEGSGQALDVFNDIERANGSQGDDLMIGDDGRNVLNGLHGDDELYGGGSRDNLHGSNGNDQLFGEAGNDYLNGGNGDDLLVGGTGNDQLVGGRGVDRLDAGEGKDTAYFHSKSDVHVDLSQETVFQDGWGNVETITGVENLHSKNGNDVLIGSTADNLFRPGFGMNTVDGGAGTDTLDYWGYNNHVEIDLKTGVSDHYQHSTGVVHHDHFASIENVYGSQQSDLIIGDANDNVLQGRRGMDFIDGDAGNDKIYGGQCNDVLLGGAGADTIYGQRGDNHIDGGEGMDVMIGGIGDDVLIWDDADFVGNWLVATDRQIDTWISRGASWQEGDLVAANGQVLVDEEGYRVNHKGDYYDANAINGHRGFDIIDAKGAAGDILIAGGEVTNVEAVIGNGLDRGTGDDNTGDDNTGGGTEPLADLFPTFDHGLSNVVMYLQDGEGNIAKIKVEGFPGGKGEIHDPDELPLQEFIDEQYSGFDLLAMTIKAGNNGVKAYGPGEGELVIVDEDTTIGDLPMAAKANASWLYDEAFANLEKAMPPSHDAMGSNDGNDGNDGNDALQRVLVQLEEVLRESDSDGLSNADFVDPFDDSFLAMGIDELVVKGSDHYKDASQRWNLVDIDQDAELDEAIQLELANAGYNSQVALNAFTFAKGLEQVVIYTDLETLSYDSNRDGLDMTFDTDSLLG